jgi:ribonuclease PH
MRIDGRENDEMRPVKIVKDFLKYAEGSVLIEVGDTRVICSASVEDKVPQFLKGTGRGWITAEYQMLPRSTEYRLLRESYTGRPSGRSFEIQRMIGRSLRSVVNTGRLGERTVWIDCDVLQADGGTRTASVTGGYIALVLALDNLKTKGLLHSVPLVEQVAAISIGLIGGEVMLDLTYSEDSTAMVDFNAVKNSSGQFIELQGTGEETPFTQDQMMVMLEYADKGIARLLDIQNEVLGDVVKDLRRPKVT